MLIYAANVYAGYEIAVVRARPQGMVIGVAAVLPILGPIIFLFMPAPVEAAPVEDEASSDPATFAVAGPQPDIAPGEIHISTSPGHREHHLQRRACRAGFSARASSTLFNRRFFETKFAGFLGEARSAADQNNILIVKSTAGQFIVERITRIAASDVHLEITLGEVRQEVMVPFADIKEIKLKPKDA